MKQKYSIRVMIVFPITLIALTLYTFSLQEKIDKLTVENDKNLVEFKLIHNLFKDVVEIPDEITFCGQKIVLTDHYVRERLQREIINLQFYKNQLELYKRRAKYFFPTIEYYLDFYGLPEDLKYLAVHESALNAKARSSANAVGLWQFMSYTAKEFNLNINYYIDERRHPIKSSIAACKYLKKLYTQFNDWPLAIASYNCGETRVENAMEQQGVDNYFDLSLPEETERYFFKIVATSLLLKQYEDEIKEESQEVNLEPIEILVEQDILEVKELSQEFNIPYRTFFNFNPQFRRHLVPYGRHTLMIPRSHVKQVKLEEKEKSYYVFKDKN